MGEQELGVLALGTCKPGFPKTPKLRMVEMPLWGFGLGLSLFLKGMETEELLLSFRQFVENELVGVYAIQDGKFVFSDEEMCRVGAIVVKLERRLGGPQTLPVPQLPPKTGPAHF